MKDFPISYEEPRKEDFWCEQDAKWHPECECKEQCFECGLIQGRYKYHCHRCNIWFNRSKESCPECRKDDYVST